MEAKEQKQWKVDDLLLFLPCSYLSDRYCRPGSAAGPICCNTIVHGDEFYYYSTPS